MNITFMVLKGFCVSCVLLNNFGYHSNLQARWILFLVNFKLFVFIVSVPQSFISNLMRFKKHAEIFYFQSFLFYQVTLFLPILYLFITFFFIVFVTFHYQPQNDDTLIRAGLLYHRYLLKNHTSIMFTLSSDK